MSVFRHTTIAAACVLLAACGGGDGNDSIGGPEQAASASSGTVVATAVADEVLVKLRSAADLPALLAGNGLVLIDQFGQRPIYRLRTAVGTDVEVLSERLEADSRVLYAEPNLLHETPEGQRRRRYAIGGDAGVYAVQWNTQALRLVEAHRQSVGEGVIVAVLDTGVDAAHPTLAGRLVPGFDFVDFDAAPDEAGAMGNFGFGHGTHVASLLAQVAPGARIMPIRVLDAEGVGNTWVLAEGLLHAVDPDGNPATDDGAKVINMSLGTTQPSKLLEDIIKAITCGNDDDDDDEDDDEDEDKDDDADDDGARCAASSGAVVVSAAGNSGDTTRYYPAAEQINGALAVAASTEAGTLASFSTRGDWVQVAAPGERIYGAIPGGAWAVWSGSSMAAPMTAGAAALLRARFPAWRPSDVTNKLIDTARPLCGNTDLRQIDPMAALSGSSAPDLLCP